MLSGGVQRLVEFRPEGFRQGLFQKLIDPDMLAYPLVAGAPTDVPVMDVERQAAPGQVRDPDRVE